MKIFKDQFIKIIKGSIFWLSSIILFTLFIYGLILYSGNKLLFILFSISYFMLFFSVFKKNNSYFYIFFAVFIFLGFWFKLVLHLIFKYQYVEPIGKFDWEPVSFDGILWVGIVVSCGIFVAKLIYDYFVREKIVCLFNYDFTNFNFYIKYRKYFWLLSITIVLLIVILNMVFGLFQIGLVPKIYLMKPFHALIIWVLPNGFILIILSLLFYDFIILKKEVFKDILILLAISSILSISILSRSLYIFQTVPIIFLLILNKSKISLRKKNYIIIIPTFLFLLLVSLFSVNELRSYYYTDSVKKYEVLNNETNTRNIDLNYFFKINKIIINRVKNMFWGLFVDRWIGIEGIMSVYSYPEKGYDVFLYALNEKRNIGTVSFYQKVCDSHYQLMDNNKFQFASLPGPGAFFYYTGSLLFVFICMTILVLFGLFCEKLIFRLLKNPFITAWFGCYLASMFSQMGVAPRQLLISLVMTISAIILLAVFQKIIFDIKIKDI